jgi:N-sulfoglucosamine sulfohydrolase
MIRHCVIASISFISILLISSAIASDSQQLPNIVVFISDDLGRGDTSVYGSPDAITPVMAKMADAGMTFNNAYVASPSCCPNRFSFLTGLMPARHGAHPNHSQVKEGTEFLFPLIQERGYTVVSFGKVAHGSHNFPGCDFNARRPTEMSENVRVWFDENPVDGPICLLVGDRRPHVPWIKESTYDPDEVTLPPYFIDTPETREHWARYLTDITGMDQEIGRILEIAKKQFGDDFLFLFTSDHGGQWPRGKWNLYDAGTRIPLIVSWPGHIEPGVRTDAMVSWVDLVPTLIDLTNGGAPNEIDGRSFAPVLLGETDSHRDEIFTTHTGDGIMNIFPIRSVRIGDYKYVHNLCPDALHTNHSDRLRKDGAGAYWDSWDAAASSDSLAAEIVHDYYTRSEFELFDLIADPLELNNLADNPNQAALLERLESELSAWTRSQGDDLQPHKEPYPASEPPPKLRPK